eukprot:3686852-Amphidinium_carterae.2
MREVFGKFYYRFPEGESPADVYIRAGVRSCSLNGTMQGSSETCGHLVLCVTDGGHTCRSRLSIAPQVFLESLYRRWETHYVDNLVIVSHELFITVFLMRRH